MGRYKNSFYSFGVSVLENRRKIGIFVTSSIINHSSGKVTKYLNPSWRRIYIYETHGTKQTFVYPYILALLLNFLSHFLEGHHY